jgi:hypothetical protein
VTAARVLAPAHYVTHNRATRIPARFVYFDSEAYRREVPRGEVQTFRCAVAMFDRRRAGGVGWHDRQVGVFDTPAGLWAWIDARTKPHARTVCVAHNVAYDLRITDGLTLLPALGWELAEIRLNRQQVFARFRRGGRTLVVCDSMSWLPMSLAKIGDLCGVAKLPLPEWDDTDAAWVARCTRDVEIVATAVRRLVEWVRADDLGNWRPTGAGQAWSAWRHRFQSHRVLAHDNEPARAAERAAAWTGRCEVWRHGRPTGGPFTEFDYAAAYAHIGAECEVPAKLVGTSTRPTLAQWSTLSATHAVLAEVVVTTEVPTVPARVDGRVCWPVGAFPTTLWENEVALAVAGGAGVEITRLWWYRRAPAIRDFCRWVLGVLGPAGASFDPVVVAAVKHWSRALVGRFGARWSEWETVGRASSSGLGLSTMIDRTEGASWQLLQVGTQLRRETAVRDGHDTAPAVMSWVMAECRCRLWRLCDLAGMGSVVYMDTDGLIVDRVGAERVLDARVPGLRVKGTWGAIEVLSPRQIVLSGRLRAAGVPTGAVRIGPSTWEAEFWDGMVASLVRGRPGEVGVARRRVNVGGVDARREHLAGGLTAPVRLGGAV